MTSRTGPEEKPHADSGSDSLAGRSRPQYISPAPIRRPATPEEIRDLDERLIEEELISAFYGLPARRGQLRHIVVALRAAYP